jgi:hypothetical protein
MWSIDELGEVDGARSSDRHLVTVENWDTVMACCVDEAQRAGRCDGRGRWDSCLERLLRERASQRGHMYRGRVEVAPLAAVVVRRRLMPSDLFDVGCDS